MVGLRLSAPETSQIRLLSIIRGVLRLAVTMTEMGGAGGRTNVNDKFKEEELATKREINLY
jgi:hypothetical protein